MRCRDAVALLAEYADDALAPRQRDEVAAHLRGCPGCRGELDALQNALGALRAAAPAGGGDLWGSFQARLTRSGSPLGCRSVLELVPEHVEGGLGAAERAGVAEHVETCASCAAEAASYRSSLAALASAAPTPAAAPDLWASFSARLEAERQPERSCRRLARDLFALAGGETGPGGRRSQAQAHLRACSACRQEFAALGTSLQVLERVGAAPPEVDLWPAFAARLEAERRETARRLSWPAFGSILRPAAGFAAVLAAALLLRAHLSGPAPVTVAVAPAVSQPEPARPLDEAGPETRVEPVEPVHETVGRAESPAPVTIRTADRPREARRTVRRPRRARVKRTYVAQRSTRPQPARPQAEPPQPEAPAPSVTERPIVVAMAPAPTAEPTAGARQSWASRLEVAYNITPGPTGVVPTESNSETAQRAVMPEAVALVEQIVGVEEAAEQPF